MRRLKKNKKKNITREKKRREERTGRKRKKRKRRQTASVLLKDILTAKARKGSSPTSPFPSSHMLAPRDLSETVPRCVHIGWREKELDVLNKKNVHLTL